MILFVICTIILLYSLLFFLILWKTIFSHAVRCWTQFLRIYAIKITMKITTIYQFSLLATIELRYQAIHVLLKKNLCVKLINFFTKEIILLVRTTLFLKWKKITGWKLKWKEKKNRKRKENSPVCIKIRKCVSLTISFNIPFAWLFSRFPYTFFYVFHTIFVTSTWHFSKGLKRSNNIQ